jgi:hypothetical protein
LLAQLDLMNEAGDGAAATHGEAAASVGQRYAVDKGIADGADRGTDGDGGDDGQDEVQPA